MPLALTDGQLKQAKSRVADPPGDRDFMRIVAAARDFAGQELTSGWTD
jgi:hypothetical protein